VRDRRKFYGTIEGESISPEEIQVLVEKFMEHLKNEALKIETELTFGTHGGVDAEQTEQSDSSCDRGDLESSKV
jgi:hypothetical protein